MIDASSPDELVGVLFIGDPHVESRQPGFRKDDFPRAVLDKLQWCLGYAARERLLPAFLGDLFEYPRDNPNWLVAELFDLLERQGAIAIYGNHDCANPQLENGDSLSLLIKGGRLRLVDVRRPWIGRMNGRRVAVGGSSYRHEIPGAFDAGKLFPAKSLFDPPPLVAWMTHHDVAFPGYDSPRVKPIEIAGVEAVVNGHIHTRCDPVDIGATRWWNPGNITRRSRREAWRTQAPAVLRFDATEDGWRASYVDVPHRPFDEVFHAAETTAETKPSGESDFVAGLRELQARRTETGAGLMEFLEANLPKYTGTVATEILRLAEIVRRESAGVAETTTP